MINEGESKSMENFSDTGTEDQQVDYRETQVNESVEGDQAIEEKIRENKYNALSVNSEEEKNFEREWYKKYAKYPKDLKDFFNEKNIEEVKKMPEEKRIFFLKMAKFYLEADISKIESDFGKDDAEKIVKCQVKERKKQLALQEKIKSSPVNTGNEESDSLRVVGKNMEKFYLSKEEGREFIFDDTETKNTDQEMMKEEDKEQRILIEISKIEKNDDRLSAYKENIDGIIGAFENSEKNKKDFNLMMKKFDVIGWHGEVKNAWRQEQVDKILEIYEDNIDNLEPSACSDFFTEILGHGDVNDLVAKYFTKRIESGKEMPKSLLKKISYWAGENLYAMDSDVVSDFLLTLINNSDKVDRSFMGNIFSSFEWDYLESFVRRLSDELYKNKDNVYKTLKNIEVLEYFKHVIDEYYFEKDSVKYNLNVFKQNNNNYFVNFKIDQVLEFYYKTHSVEEKRNCLEMIKNEYNDLKQEIPDTALISDKEIIILFDDFKESIDAYFIEKENKRRKDIYDDENIRKAYDVEPAIFEYKKYGLEKKEQKKKDFCYTKISNKYGIIYGPDGATDSFFSLSGGKADKENNLTVNEVLAEEGFKKEHVGSEEYKKMILTYKTLIELPMREKIENEFGIGLKDFNIREQVQFVNFLSSKTVKEVEKVKGFLNRGKNEEAKNNRIKSFLSLEFGEEMGEKILKIGEKMDAESADAVFAKYEEIINLTNKSKGELEDLFKTRKDITEEEKEKIVRNLMGKANKILIDFSGKARGRKKIDTKEIMESLEDCKTNLILTASIYKGIDKGGEIKFEDLEGVTFEQKTAADLSREEISQMKKIYAKNYEYNEEFQKVIVENFENILKDLKEKTILYLFKEDDEVVAFNRFDDMGEGRKYFGSFNVKPIMGGSDIGKALMQVSLEKEAEANEIEADCIPETLISARYIGGKCGFVVKKLDTDYKKTGVPLFNIERKEENKKYRYFNYSDKQIINEYESNNPDNEYNESAVRFILKFNPKAKEFIEMADNLINKEGYVISNYVFAKKGKEVYCAFEKE